MMELLLVQIFQVLNLLERLLQKLLLSIIVLEKVSGKLLFEFGKLLVDDSEHVLSETGQSVVISGLNRGCSGTIVKEADFSEVVAFT